jgi:hypothetical protein
MTDSEKLEKLIEKGLEVLRTHKENPPGVFGFPTLESGAFSAWRSQCLHFIQSRLPPASPYLTEFQANVERGYQGSVKSGIGILRSLKEDLEAGDLTQEPNDGYDPVKLISILCDRFHLVARQLRSRHDDRQSLDVQDEYDVQDLLHSLLLLYFNDVRAEEWTPSYAGKAARMDFLLKHEQIVVETKKTRSGLRAKEVGSQLIEDIARYESHPDCQTLVCFIYDPDGRISNPRGIENDLRRTDVIPNVEVRIRP